MRSIAAHVTLTRTSDASFSMVSALGMLGFGDALVPLPSVVKRRVREETGRALEMRGVSSDAMALAPVQVAQSRRSSSAAHAQRSRPSWRRCAPPTRYTCCAISISYVTGRYHAFVPARERQVSRDESCHHRLRLTIASDLQDCMTESALSRESCVRSCSSS